MELGMCWDMPEPVGLSSTIYYYMLLSVALLWLRLALSSYFTVHYMHRYFPICKSMLFHTRGRCPEFHLAFGRTEGHTGCSPWSSRRI